MLRGSRHKCKTNVYGVDEPLGEQLGGAEGAVRTIGGKADREVGHGRRSWNETRCAQGGMTLENWWIRGRSEQHPG